MGRLIMHLLLFAAVLGTCIASPRSSVSTASGDTIPLVAVGFDLTDRYGTASVRLMDGSVRQTAKVVMPGEYATTMRYLGLPTSRHMAPPYQWKYDNSFADIPRQLRRKARKAIGLPASEVVGVLSAMLSELRKSTEESLTTLFTEQGYDLSSTSVSVDRVMLTTPQMPALYDEDLADAALHSGIELLQLNPVGEGSVRYVDDPDRNKTWMLTPWVQRQPRHPHAYFAAHGLAGNLNHPISPSADPAITKHNVLLAHLTRDGLEIAPQVKLTNRSCSHDWGQHMGWYNGSLGWPTPLAQDEWRQGVRDMLDRAIVDVVSHYYNSGNINVTDVIFAGEMGGVSALHETVLGYIDGLDTQSARANVWPHTDSEEEWQYWVENGGSHGAAVMAWQYLAEEPLWGDTMECWAENSRNLNHHWEIRNPPSEERERVRLDQDPMGEEL